MTWIEAGAVSLRYAIEGKAAPRIVLIHEMGGCLESWDAVIAELGPDVGTLAYDVRGAGMSEKPAVPPTIDLLADDLDRLLSALSLEGPMIFVGCAVGAAIAIRFAARFPERVAGLLLLAPATGIAPDKRAALLDLADQVERDGMRERILARFDISYPAAYFEDRTDRPAVRGRLLQNDPRSYAACYRMLCDMDLTTDLPRIAAPTVVVAGSNDTTRPPDLVRLVAEAIPGATFDCIASGHALHILTPAPVAALIRSLENSSIQMTG